MGKLLKRCRGRRLYTLIFPILLAACGNDAREDVRMPLHVERSELGDTTVVRTIGGSVWGDTMSLVSDLSIGELEGENAYIFGSIRGLEVGPDGRIYVVDGQARELRIFAPDGEHLQSVGRAGDGPGEFRMPDQVRLASDGRIVVRDAAMRFSVFSREGDYVGGWLPGAGYSTNAPFYLDGSDRILNPTMPDRLVWYTLDGTSGDTLPIPSRGYEAPQLRVASGGGIASYSIPFMPREWWAMSREGAILTGMNEQYVLERLEANGKVLRIERLAEPVAVASEEAAQARQALMGTMQSADPSWRWDGPEIPAVKPAYGTVIPGADGTIWVMRSTRGVKERNPNHDPERPNSGFPTWWREARVMDVFDSGGAYLGPVKLPDEVSLFALPVLSANAVVAAVTHRDGYPQVIRYRLEPAEHP